MLKKTELDLSANISARPSLTVSGAAAISGGSEAEAEEDEQGQEANQRLRTRFVEECTRVLRKREKPHAMVIKSPEDAAWGGRSRDGERAGGGGRRPWGAGKVCFLDNRGSACCVCGCGTRRRWGVRASWATA